MLKKKEICGINDVTFDIFIFKYDKIKKLCVLVRSFFSTIDYGSYHIFCVEKYVCNACVCMYIYNGGICF